MIVPMQKMTLFISARHQDSALRELRKLGLVHIQHLKTPVSEDVSQLENDLNAVEKAFIILGQTAVAAAAPIDIEKNRKRVAEILNLSGERQRIRNQIEEKSNVIGWFERWGRISAADIASLNTCGIYIRLYTVDRKQLDSVPTSSFAEILHEDKSQIRVALVSESEDAKLDVKEEFPPEESYQAVSQAIQDLENRTGAIDKQLRKIATMADQIAGYRQELEKRLEFAQVRSGMESSGEIVYLQGYCPRARVDKLLTAAERQGWGILSEEPEIEDNPPTLLKMSRWVQIIKPVFDFLGTVPGYREYDISKYFLMFFALFVAMIIGDAGYGLIFLTICILAHRKFARGNKPLPLAIKLFYVLSATTIAWGTITGNWFGAVQIGALPFFKALTIPQLATFPELFPGIEADGPQQRVILICFIIAITQLSLANIMNFINTLPQLKSIAHLGWTVLMAGLFLVVLNLVLGMAMPGFTVYLIVFGLVSIIVFMNQEKGVNFFKGVLAGLGGAFNTFLNSISSFSNIISYIRLFAVGMATVAIASSFNNIAAPMMKGFAFPAAIIVLLIGHSLNIVMGLLSVIVHGIRLNVLEFSSQLGMEWTGYEYKPFRDNDKKITEGEIQ